MNHIELETSAIPSVILNGAQQSEESRLWQHSSYRPFR